MTGILFESKDTLQERLKKSNELLNTTNLYVNASNSLLLLLYSRLSNKQMFYDSDDV